MRNHELLVKVVNEFMRESPPDMKDARSRLASVTSHALMTAGKYRGFNWTYWQDIGFEEWPQV